MLFTEAVVIIIQILKLGEDARMINFDEEIKKFSPSTEVDQAEDVILRLDATKDLTDLMLEIVKDKES